MVKKNYSNGFKTAFIQIKICERTDVISDLMNILGVGTRASFHNYLHGKTIPPADIAQEIEIYFKSKGIENVYG